MTRKIEKPNLGSVLRRVEILEVDSEDFARHIAYFREEISKLQDRMYELEGKVAFLAARRVRISDHREGSMNTPWRRRMKLFVWHGVLVDYTGHLACAMARDVDEARRVLLRDARDHERKPLAEDIAREPDLVFISPAGACCWGGG